MNGKARDTIDSAIGYLLAIAGLAFGFVSWLISTTGISGYGNSNMWFLSALILGVLAIGIVLDEARVFKDASLRRTEFALSWLMMIAGFACGVAGFVFGLNGDAMSPIWLWSGLILAVISVGVMADEGRRLRSGSAGAADEVIGGLLSLAALCIGVAGFLMGISGQTQAIAWMQGGVICSLTATAFMFDGERRAAAAAMRSFGSPELGGAGGRI